MRLDYTSWFVIGMTVLILVIDVVFLALGGVKNTVSDHMALWGWKKYHVVVWLWLFLTYHFWGYMWTLWLVRTHIIVGPH